MAVNDTEFQALCDDVDRAIKRVSKGYVEYKNDAKDNLYPLIQELIEQCDARMTRTEAMVAELIEESESVIHPDLAEQIYATIELGQKLCDELDKLTLDDVTKKRVVEMTEAYRIAANLTIESVADVALEPGDMGEEGEEEEEEEEEEEDDDAESDAAEETDPPEVA